MVKQTRKAKKRVLDVDTISKIPALEKLLKSGKITIVLIYADWCGHCHTFKKNVWNPMCSKEATHNRVAVNEKVLANTSLANANIEGYPSVLVVNENGKAEEFKTPEGKPTNAIPTPKTPEEMTRIVNVPLSMNKSPASFVKNVKTLPFMENISKPVETPPLLSSPSTPNGKTYEPTPMVASPKKQEQIGGNMYEMMKGGALPMAVLKALNTVMMGGKRSTRKTHKRKRRMIKA